MTKRLLILSLAVSMMLSVPVLVKAAEAEMLQTEQTLDDDITISVNGQWVTVNGAQGLTLEVVSLTGRQIKTIKIESHAQRIELNIPKGCYILKIGKVVRKVAVR
jgi:hypothetical protein